MDFATIAQRVGTFIASGQGDFVGGVAASLTINLVGKAYGAAKRRFSPQAKQTALHDTIKRALIATFLDHVDNPLLLEHYITVFGKWATQEAVVEELVLLIDPRADAADAALNLPFLVAQFDELDEYDAASLTVDLTTRIERFVEAYYRFAERNPELVDDDTLKITYLKAMLVEMRSARANREATLDAVERTAGAVERMEPHIAQLAAGYRALAGSDAATQNAKLEAEIKAYVLWLNKRSSKITLRGIERDGRQLLELPLETAYAPLQRARTRA